MEQGEGHIPKFRIPKRPRPPPRPHHPPPQQHEGGGLLGGLKLGGGCKTLGDRDKGKLRPPRPH